MAFGFLPHAEGSVKIFVCKARPKLKVVGGYF
jgi:hypothetical protein